MSEKHQRLKNVIRDFEQNPHDTEGQGQQFDSFEKVSIKGGRCSHSFTA